MSTLLLRLAAPLQSWGIDSKFDIRRTGREPSKSGVIGLICAALGIKRDDDEMVSQLATLRFGVRVDKEGHFVRDFHMVKPKKGEPYVTNRYYLADAEFLVGFESVDEEFLKKIESEIGAGNLIGFERNLLSLDGQTEYGTCDDKVSLLTVDEYRKYRKLIPNTDDWFWLISPWSTPCNGFKNSGAVVAPAGNFYSRDCYFSYGVRPFCIFSSAIFESEEK